MIIDLDGESVEVGTLRAYERRGQSTTFEYAPSYLQDRRSYPIEPALPLSGGVFAPPAGKVLANGFADGAPDRWGQNLMRRAEQRQANQDGRTPRSLGSVDYLLGVHDELRQGALRYRLPASGDYLAPAESGVPTLVSLARLLAASDRFIDGDDADVRDLLDAGGSLGGARPKAAVRDEHGALCIAKFPRRDDGWDVELWEHVEAELARQAGIDVPPSRLVTVGGAHVFVSQRFDRAGAVRLGFASALTLIEASDMESRSYLEVADAVERFSPRPGDDFRQLYRRMAFSVLTGNSDDHLRNHGFLRRGGGWALSPAYDLNPVADHPGAQALAIDMAENRSSIELVRSVAPHFRLSDAEATGMIAQVESATRGWREMARRAGARHRDVTAMEAAFERAERAIAASYG